MNPVTFSHWRTSSYSSGDPNNCVEIGATLDARAVRDTKLGAESPLLAFSARQWRSFTAATKAGRFRQRD
ncbi:DUF397 domain-containing protein [Actinokineospora sp.]|uniref:DUF397 domain-containing protein n=1 Tax=Actinokineospora sp. TaxID=1872133 RepID=UPI004037F000